MCWDVDPKTGEGHCIPLCVGSAGNPTCEDECRQCAVGGGPLAVCLESCNPVLQDCDEGQGCYPAYNTWICAVDASGRSGEAGNACEFINGCDPGNSCVDPTLLPMDACEPGGGCCTPACDPAMPDPCPDSPAGVQCVAYNNDAVADGCAEATTVGICIVPPR